MTFKNSDVLTDYVALLVDDVLNIAVEVVKKDNSWYLDERSELLRSSFNLVEADTEVNIVVSSEIASDNPNSGPLIVRCRIVHGEIEIVINGAYQPTVLKTKRSQLIDNFRGLLSKSFDAIMSSKDQKSLSEPVQDVVDEALARAESFIASNQGKHTREQLLDHIHSGSRWQLAVTDLDSRSLANVFKAAYSAIVDAGLL